MRLQIVLISQKFIPLFEKNARATERVETTTHQTRKAILFASVFYCYVFISQDNREAFKLV